MMPWLKEIFIDTFFVVFNCETSTKGIPKRLKNVPHWQINKYKKTYIKYIKIWALLVREITKVWLVNLLPSWRAEGGFFIVKHIYYFYFPLYSWFSFIYCLNIS